MNYGILSCIPILILILGVLITKKIAPMMILASICGAVILYGSDILSGYISMMYGVLSDPTYQFVLILLLLFGAMIRFFQKSGALSGLRAILSGASKGPRQPLLLSALLSLILFVDDYLALLTVSFTMREVTDRSGIPREHLAYQVGTMTPSVSVLIPITSWTAFTVGLISNEGLGYLDYVRAIPMMYFPIFTLIAGILLAMGKLPKVGALKESYARIKAGGSTLPPKEEAGESIVDMEVEEESAPSSPLNFLLPVLSLVGFLLYFEMSLIHGLMGALLMQSLLYSVQRLLSPWEIVSEALAGAKSMAPMVILIFFAFLLSHGNAALGFTEYLLSLLSASLAPQLLALFVFLLIAGITFATSGYWIIQVITVPLFISLALTMHVYPPLVIAAMMSGAVFGSMLCFYSDVLFLVASGTGVGNLRQVRVSAPYLLTCALLSALGFLITGYLL